MGLTLALTRNVLNTYIGWKAQVLHDLHESVAYLYDNTVGDGPYNAWLDPILTDEWQMIGWHNVSEMTKMGMPGVFTHGTFDTWTPGYLMFMAATHNGISRLYETFGNGGADTLERRLGPNDTARSWYKQNPPLPVAMWSQRNNNNYQQTGLLVSLNHFADNKNLFLKNFYLKSKRSILKPKTEGPAAYVFPADDPRPGPQADLLRILQLQGCEILEIDRRVYGDDARETSGAPGPERPWWRERERQRQRGRGIIGRPEEGSGERRARDADVPGGQLHRAHGSAVQPHCRHAARLPVLGAGRSAAEPLRRHRLDVRRAVQRPGRARDGRQGARRADGTHRRRHAAPGGVVGSGSVFAVNHNADPSLATLRYRFRGASGVEFDVAEEPFEAGGKKFNRGSFIIRGIKADELNRAANELGLTPVALDAAPSVKMHPARAARVALMHTWINTQDEGWWRLALDQLAIPFDYISTQDVAKDAQLRAKYDVILFPPVGRASGQTIISGMPMFGNPIPWKTTELTPNIGKIDSTDDIRPGLGWEGMANLERFVRDGGVLIGVDDTASFAVQFGLTHGVSVTPAQRLKITGAVLRSKLVDGTSPLAYGYDDALSIYSSDGPIFGVSNTVGGRGGRGGGSGEARRATGRGTPDDPDLPQGRPPSSPLPEDPRVEPWQAAPIREDQLRNGVNIIPPAQRPRVVFRYGDARDLLVSGLLDGGTEIAQRPMVVDVPIAKGHVILFSNNPIWRGETHGSYFMVLNAILNHDSLDAGRKLDQR